MTKSLSRHELFELEFQRRAARKARAYGLATAIKLLQLHDTDGRSVEDEAWIDQKLGDVRRKVVSARHQQVHVAHDRAGFYELVAHHLAARADVQAFGATSSM